MSFATRLWPDGIASASGPTVSRRRSTEWVGLRPACLSQVLQVFRTMLGTGEAADLGGADALVWAYLRPVQGLRAQIGAIAVLRQATFALTTPSMLRLPLLDMLDGHARRLSSARRLPHEVVGPAIEDSTQAAAAMGRGHHQNGQWSGGVDQKA